MIPIQTFSTGVLAEFVRRQPASAARTSFAWQIAVGAGLAGKTTVELTDGVLHVRARDPRWLKDVRDLRQQVLLRLQHLLGSDIASIRFHVVDDRPPRS